VSLQNVFAYMGDKYDVNFLQTISGLAFGFHYWRDGDDIFTSACFDLADGIKFATKQLGYPCKQVTNDSAQPTLDVVRRAILADTPPILGPTSYAKLTYNPQALLTSLSYDQYVVAVGLDEEKGLIYLSDPDGFGMVPMDIKDFVEAWSGKSLPCQDYKASYSAFLVSRRDRTPSASEILTGTLIKAVEQLKGSHRTPREYGGLLAESRLAKDLRDPRISSKDSLVRLLTHMTTFTFKLGHCNRYDAACYLATNKHLIPPEQRDALSHASQGLLASSDLFLRAMRTSLQMASALSKDEPVDFFLKIIASLMDRIVERETAVCHDLADLS